MKCIINGRLLLEDRIADDLVIVFDEKIRKIVKVQEVTLADYEIIDAGGNYVSPGLVDMHVHGYLGADVSDGDVQAVEKIARGIIQNGVTAWCPTTMTVSKAEIEAAFDCVRALKNSGRYYGARILGVNSEGPFISADKKGAQAEEYILKPDADFIIKHADIIKLFTIAPEVDGAIPCIEKVRRETDVLISIGHTNADYEQALEGIEKGAANVTHLFNAMSPLTHRNPGVVGAALNTPVSTELIADTFHVEPALFGLLAKIKGNKLCLITDCIRAGGMPDGDYTLGGQPLRKDGIQCLLPDGTIAGSVLKLNQAVYNLYANTDLELYEAVNCASLHPAIALGEADEIGSLEEGKRADIVIADDHFNVITTILNGEIK